VASNNTNNLRKLEERQAGSRRCKIWCTVKDDYYAPLSLESTYTPSDELVKAMEASGFKFIQLEAVIITKLLINEKEEDKY
jgi:hypothetical protein